MSKFYIRKEYPKVFVPVNKNITVYFIIKNSTISYGVWQLHDVPGNNPFLNLQPTEQILKNTGFILASFFKNAYQYIPSFKGEKIFQTSIDISLIYLFSFLFLIIFIILQESCK